MAAPSNTCSVLLSLLKIFIKYVVSVQFKRVIDISVVTASLFCKKYVCFINHYLQNLLLFSKCTSLVCLWFSSFYMPCVDAYKLAILEVSIFFELVQPERQLPVKTSHILGRLEFRHNWNLSLITSLTNLLSFKSGIQASFWTQRAVSTEHKRNPY